MPWKSSPRSAMAAAQEGEEAAPPAAPKSPRGERIVGAIAKAHDVTDQSALQLVGAGAGGVPEMVQYMSEDEVQWALLRFEYGSGTFARTKIVFLQFIGDSVPVIKRGQANALTKTVTHFLRSRGSDHFHASLTVRELAEVDIENIMNNVAEYFVVDSIASESTSSMIKGYHEQLAREAAEAIEREKAAAELREKRRRQQQELAASVVQEMEEDMAPTGAPGEKRKSVLSKLEVPSESNPDRMQRRASVQILTHLAVEGLTQVAEGGNWNWVLIGPDIKQLPLLGGGSGGIEEMRAAAEDNRDLVMFGLLRVQFSTPGFSQRRFVMLHIIGDSVKAVKRGKWNNLRPPFEQRFGEFCQIHAICPDTDISDITLDTVLAKVGHVSEYTTAGEQENSVSTLRAYQQAMINEKLNMELAKRPAPKQVLKDKFQKKESLKEVVAAPAEPQPNYDDSEDEEEDAAIFAPHHDHTIAFANNLVRVKREANWALIRPRRRPLKLKIKAPE